MTVKQLKEKLQKLPDNMDVFIKQENNGDFALSPVENATVKSAPFSEHSRGPVLAKLKILLLTDNI